jgi:vitamin K-dependent gamma-carboxylase-like protein
MNAIARWWFAPAPAERLAVLRIAIGAYALVWLGARMTELIAVARLPKAQFAPVGIVAILDEPLPLLAVVAIAAATLLLLAAFVAGLAYRVVAPLAALGLVWTLGYRSSWGVPFHTENLLVLHVIALACAPAADAWSVSEPRGEATAGYGWPVKLLASLTVATYVMAGIAKLRIAGAAWLAGDALRDQIAYDNLRKVVFGGDVAPLAGVIGQPGLLMVASVLAIVIELAAPFALVGRRADVVWASCVWLFHVGVVLAMNIWFPYPLLGLAFLPLFAVERPVLWLIGQGMRRA